MYEKANHGDQFAAISSNSVIQNSDLH